MEMDGYKKRFDWASLLLGIVLVVLGCVSIMHPDKSLHLLCILVGVGLLLLGIYELWARSKMQEWLGYRSGWLLGTGILDIILGIVFLVYQNFGTTVIAVVFALWFIIGSANELTIAGFFRQLNVGYYWLFVYPRHSGTDYRRSFALLTNAFGNYHGWADFFLLDRDWNRKDYSSLLASTKRKVYNKYCNIVRMQPSLL